MKHNREVEMDGGEKRGVRGVGADVVATASTAPRHLDDSEAIEAGDKRDENVVQPFVHTADPSSDFEGSTSVVILTRADVYGLYRAASSIYNGYVPVPDDLSTVLCKLKELGVLGSGYGILDCNASADGATYVVSVFLKAGVTLEYVRSSLTRMSLSPAFSSRSLESVPPACASNGIDGVNSVEYDPMELAFMNGPAWNAFDDDMDGFGSDDEELKPWHGLAASASAGASASASASAGASASASASAMNQFVFMPTPLPFVAPDHTLANSLRIRGAQATSTPDLLGLVSVSPPPLLALSSPFVSSSPLSLAASPSVALSPCLASPPPVVSLAAKLGAPQSFKHWIMRLLVAIIGCVSRRDDDRWYLSGRINPNSKVNRLKVIFAYVAAQEDCMSVTKQSVLLALILSVCAIPRGAPLCRLFKPKPESVTEFEAWDVRFRLLGFQWKYPEGVKFSADDLRELNVEVVNALVESTLEAMQASRAVGVGSCRFS